MSKSEGVIANLSISEHATKPNTDIFLKWAGGKTWAIELVKEVYNPDYRLVDLTLGGGAIPLGLQPKQALLCDLNPYLINLWKWVQQENQFSIPLKSDGDYFSEIREKFNADPLNPLAPEWFYLLNHTCYNGLYRSSSIKAFNVSWGKYKQFHGQKNLEHYQNAIAHWEFKAQGWEQTLREIKEDDFIIFDPPYDGEGFTQYFGKFTPEDQINAAQQLAALNNPVIAFNSATELMVKTYTELGFDVEIKDVARNISCTGDRTPAKEMVATKNLPQSTKVIANLSITDEEKPTPPHFAARPKPALPDDAPTLVTAFTCGGLFEIGAIHAGFKPVLGVEFYPAKGRKDDAVKQRQSKAAADNYERNFGSHILRKSIEEAVRDRDFELFVQSSGIPDAFHCSPSCTNLSQGNTQGEEDEGDISAAKAICCAIAQLGFPKIFTLENVEAYKKSQSWGIIRELLYAYGYGVAEDVVMASDYGVPQDRKRFIVRAVKGHFAPALPEKVSKKMGWHYAIADLIEDLPDGELAPWQLERLPHWVKEPVMLSHNTKMMTRRLNEPSFTIVAENSTCVARTTAILLNGDTHCGIALEQEPSFTITQQNANCLGLAPSALLIERNGASDERITTRQPEEPVWTIRSSIGTDGAGRNRTNTINALVNGRVKKLNARAIARLQSVPDWYELPEQMKDSGPLLGNGVPPVLSEAILQSLKPFIKDKETMITAEQTDREVYSSPEIDTKASDFQYLYLSPSDIDLERGSQTRLNKNEKGIKDFYEKMTEGVWRFDDPNDCPLLIELENGERIPANGHTRIEAASRVQELKSDLKMLCKIKRGTWFDVIYESSIADINSAYPKSTSDRVNAARRLIEQLAERYKGVENIPRRGRGRDGATLAEEWGSNRLSQLFGLSRATIDKLYVEVDFNRQISDYPDGTRVELTEHPDFELSWYLKDKVGELGVVNGSAPKEGLFVHFDKYNPEFVHPRFLQKSDKPPVQVKAPAELAPKPSSSTSVEAELKEVARRSGLPTGSQTLPSPRRNTDVPPAEQNAEPPIPSPVNTEKKSEENPSPEEQNIISTTTTTGEWTPEVGGWVQVQADCPTQPGNTGKITCLPFANVAIVEFNGRTRERIDLEFLQPIYEKAEEIEEVAPSQPITQDQIVKELIIGVKQLSPDELAWILNCAQLGDAHKEAVKRTLFADKDANLVEAARLVANNVQHLQQEELEVLEGAIANTKQRPFQFLAEAS